MPDTPYIGIPALRNGALSVAPVLINGTTGTPAHISLVICSIGCITAGLSGEGGLGCAVPFGVTLMRLSSTIFTKVCCVWAAVSVGRMRQLTRARAVCGKALSACPPSSRVATQVVRIVALYEGMALSRATAAESGLGLATAARSAAICPL